MNTDYIPNNADMAHASNAPASVVFAILAVVDAIDAQTKATNRQAEAMERIADALENISGAYSIDLPAR